MILVVGATGQLGSLVVRRLLDLGRPVRILIRPGSAFDGLAAAGAAPVIGDLKEPRSLEAAVTGVDTVITTANSARRGEPDNPSSVDLHGNASLIEAARAAGVDRFVFVSAFGAAPGHPVPFLAAKGASEQRLRDSGMTFTILVPAPYLDVWVAAVVAAPALGGREIVYVGDGLRRHAMVSIEDVASFAITSIDHPAARNAVLPIGGPAAFSWLDAVGAFERALGRPLPHRGVPVGAPEASLPAELVPFLTALATTDTLIDMDDAVARFGVRLTSLDAWVRRATTPVPVLSRG
jgi:uncharacterized protein YbjT (DUF2867 family)